MSHSSPIETKRVLIWAKTYPELSDKHRETVCTGGCTEDGQPIRLYPVPLRYLKEKARYRLYDWVTVRVQKHPRDRRPESYLVVGEPLQGEHLDPSGPGWPQRRDTVFRDTRWHYHCLEDLKRAQSTRRTSMGFVRVREVERVWIKYRTAEDRAQHNAKLARLKQQAKQTDMFGLRGQQFDLQFQDHRIHVAWRCQSPSCPGHTAGILDWGLAELGRREGAEKARERIEALANLAKHELAFFVGNFKAHQGEFGIIGLWYPHHLPPPNPQLSLF